VEGNRKKILVTDTHLGIKKSNDIYLELVYNLFCDICKKAKEEGIEELIHAGDFFDNRKHLSLKALFYAEKIGNMINNTFKKSYLILGNHDLFYKDRYYPCSHQVFTKYENIHVIYEPMVHDDILLVPWMLSNDSFYPYINLNDYDAKYCIGHFDICGAKMGEGSVSNDGRLKFEDFEKFKYVFSGHYHTKGLYRSGDTCIEYIGAPYHQTFNDSGTRGYYILDEDIIHFIQWDKYPKYITLIARDDIWNECDIKGNVVRLTFLEDYGSLKNSEIIKQVQDLHPLQLFTLYQFGKGMTKDEMDEVDVELKDAEGIHVEFVEKSEPPSHIKKKVVTKMLGQLYSELRGE
jgi:DNA repair exonuclease SbcCD nuclease subunit